MPSRPDDSLFLSLSQNTKYMLIVDALVDETVRAAVRSVARNARQEFVSDLAEVRYRLGSDGSIMLGTLL